MITVKGSKSQSSAPASPQDRYALESLEARSNLPYYIGIFISTVVIYLKSALGSWAEPHRPEPHPHQPQDPGMHLGQQATEGPAAAAPATHKQQLQDATSDPATAGGWGEQAFAALPAVGSSSWNGDVSALTVMAGQSQGHLIQNEPVRFDATASNDNRRQSAHRATISGDAGQAGPGAPSHSVPKAIGGSGNATSSEERKNRAPQNAAAVDLGNHFGSAALLIALTDLLKNTTDPDGNPLHIQDFKSTSGILAAADGGVNFVPTQTGLVTFTYTITDGQLTTVQHATLDVKPNMISGTDGDDMLAGGAFVDDISGGSGNDSIGGGGNNDSLDGGTGDDTIFAGDGDDIVHGGSGNDTIYGGPGNDTLYGDRGNDRIFGGPGADNVQGGPGDDIIIGDKDAANDTYDGGPDKDTLDYSATTTAVTVDVAAGTASSAEIGTDTIANFEVILTGTGDDVVKASSQSLTVNAGAGNDHVDGSLGNDKLSGGSGNDILSGADGNDLLIGGSGADILDCGAGDDAVMADTDTSDDTITGGAGRDTLDYSATSAAVDANFITGIVTGSEIGTDTVSGFEIVALGSGSDHVTVGNDPLVMSGGGGNDVFEFVVNVGSGSGNVQHQVTDFLVGDCLRTSQYDVLEDSSGSGNDSFQDAFGNVLDQFNIPIRVRHELINAVKQTFVDSDLNNDGSYDLTVFLDGQHVLHVVQHI